MALPRCLPAGLRGSFLVAGTGPGVGKTPVAAALVLSGDQENNEGRGPAVFAAYSVGIVLNTLLHAVYDGRF